MKIPRYAQNYRELGALLGVKFSTLCWWSHACDDAPKSRSDGRHPVASWQKWIADNADDIDLRLTPLRKETAVTRLRVERVRTLASNGAKLHVEMRKVEEGIADAHNALADKLRGLCERVGSALASDTASQKAKAVLEAEIAEIVHFLTSPGERRPWERRIAADHPAHFDLRHASRTKRRTGR